MRILTKNVKNLICEVLKDYAKGEEYVCNKERTGQVIKDVNPHFHNSIKYSVYDGTVRRYRFNIVTENSWNRINITEELKKQIENKVKQILVDNGYNCNECILTSYYPEISSRPQYAPWIRCLNIYFLDKN